MSSLRWMVLVSWRVPVYFVKVLSPCDLKSLLSWAPSTLKMFCRVSMFLSIGWFALTVAVRVLVVVMYEGLVKI